MSVQKKSRFNSISIPEVDEVEETVETAQPSPAPALALPTTTLVRAVYGIMVDPTTGETFSPTPRPVEKVTSWMKSQIDAGKMEVS
jgi:hypothetical protein